MKTNTITSYTCDYCGKAYEKMADAAVCEKKCGEFAKKMQEQEARKKEVEVATEVLTKLLRKYNDDYGEFPTISLKNATRSNYTIEPLKKKSLENVFFF